MFCLVVAEVDSNEDVNSVNWICDLVSSSRAKDGEGCFLRQTRGKAGERRGGGLGGLRNLTHGA